MDESLTGKLIYTARLCRTLRADLLLQLGIYAGQDTLLKNLARDNGQTMKSLARNLGVRPPTITKMVTRMESQGLVRREDSPNDARLSHVFITEAGSRLLDRVDEAWARAEEIALGSLKDKQAKQLRKILAKIQAGLAAHREGADR